MASCSHLRKDLETVRRLAEVRVLRSVGMAVAEPHKHLHPPALQLGVEVPPTDALVHDLGFGCIVVSETEAPTKCT